MLHCDCLSQVALLAEGVDRNQIRLTAVIIALSVALLAEGVDRNTVSGDVTFKVGASPSSRRAWIEIALR